MAYASALNDAGYLSILQPAPGSWDRGHRRLACCIAISTVAIIAGLEILRLPARLESAREVPAVMDVSLREPAKPAVERPEGQPATASTIPSAAPDRREAAAPSAPQETDSVQTAIRKPPIDWQGSLERASAEVVERSAETVSLHPEFDELRRIAAVRYAEPRTGKPPPIWENVERDIYGRTVVRLGHCYRVLDDPNVGNRYAFETFERTMTFCGGPGEKRQEFPWVEGIKARYAYLRNPDGYLPKAVESQPPP